MEQLVWYNPDELEVVHRKILCNWTRLFEKNTSKNKTKSIWIKDISQLIIKYFKSSFFDAFTAFMISIAYTYV